MLLIYSFIILLLCFFPIVIIYANPLFFKKNIFKNHLIIFFIKLIIISMFIYFFISKFNISNIQLFIIVGCCIVVICHFIEGFVLQNIILKNEHKK